jgi:hypothetical protein
LLEERDYKEVNHASEKHNNYVEAIDLVLVEGGCFLWVLEVGLVDEVNY